MTLANSLKRTLDKTRSISAKLGLRPYTVMVRVTTWDGAKVGLGDRTDVDAFLSVNGLSPKVRQLSQREIVNSGGLYAQSDVEVIVTPDFTTPDGFGGTSRYVFDPAPTGLPTEVAFQLTGQGMETGAWFKLIEKDVTKPLAYRIVLRRTAERR